MNEQQKQILIRQIGVLEGLTWVALIDEKLHCITEALDAVVGQLQELLKEE